MSARYAKILPVQTRVRQTRVTQRGLTRRPNLKLKALRINRGMAREDLSRVTGVSIESIRLAELGFVPGLRIQAALADALKVQILEIWPIEIQR